MHAMTIGQVAKHAGVGVETVRFYEHKGLLDEPPRRESGYRPYPWALPVGLYSCSCLGSLCQRL